MALSENIHVSYEEYLKLKESSEEIIEYIDGIVYMPPYPSTKHQKISSKLHAQSEIIIYNDYLALIFNLLIIF